ncbi:MAG: hypothetical protein KIS92_25685 [Planctomycetota bacterium]|nr:hypothetical protein [Planctomycetota bacterium]
MAAPFFFMEKAIQDSIAKFLQLAQLEPNKRLYRSAIVSGGGAEWLSQCLLQISLEETLGERFLVRREYRGSSKGQLDLACLAIDTKAVRIAIEVKAPWTDRYGIKHKTDRKGGIEKDLSTLRHFKKAGAEYCLQVIVVVELFLKHSDGSALNAVPRKYSRKDFEMLARDLWRMKYPTVQDYDSSRARSYIDNHKVMCELSPISKWKGIEIGEAREGIIMLWNRFYRLH